MRDAASILPLKSQKPGIQLLVVMMVFLVVTIVMSLFILLSGSLIFGQSAREISYAAGQISGRQLAWVKYSQTLQHLSMFLIPAIISGWMMTGSATGYFGIRRVPGLLVVLFTIILSFVIIPLTGDLAEWNSRMELPQFLSGIGEWMTAREDRASILTGWLISSEGTGGLLLNLVILAIVPAAGEELMFRGVIQQLATRGLRSPHLAIILTAIIFSSVHLQFFGFLPRLLLGLVYGYLFYWSGSVWLPVIAHMVNNAIPVVTAYFIGWENINTRVSDYLPEESYTIVAPLFLTVVLLYAIRDQVIRS